MIKRLHELGQLVVACETYTNDKAGILYNNSQWKNSQLVKVLSEKVDKCKYAYFTETNTS